MAVHVKLRLIEDLDLSEPTSSTKFNVLRSLEVVLTLVLISLVATYYKYHLEILRLIGSASTLSAWFAVLELVVLMLGVLPPGIEATVEIPQTDAAAAAGEPAILRHVDCYCLLQLVRMPNLVKWTMTLLLHHVKSPDVLGWQHSMHVPSSFRIKYVLTRFPLQMIGTLMLLIWMSGSFVLHVVDPLYAGSLWLAAYDCWILILDAPPHTPHSIPGQAIVMLASFAGALCVAVVTAALTTAAELAPEEAQLVRKLETIEEVRKRERCALAFMQATARIWLLLRRERAQHAVLSGAGGQGAPKDEMGRRRLARLRRAAREAASAFRSASRHVARLTHVHTLGVLHNTLDVVKADQQRLSSKLDMVVQMLTETTKGMQALQGRIDSTEDKQWPPGGLAPSASELSVGKSHAAPSQAPTRLVPL